MRSTPAMFSSGRDGAFAVGVARFRVGGVLIAVLAVCAALCSAGSVAAQSIEMSEEVLDFDAPEAWAMKYFSSLTSFHGLRSTAPRESRWDLGVELLQAPHLDTEQRTVGFGGRKEEELNRLPVWARLRGSVRLGERLLIEVGWVPPVEVDGVEADFVAAAISGPLFAARSWDLGWRLYAQEGTATADFTCTAEDAAQPPGSAGNLFGCEAPSSDEVKLDHYGAELIATWSLGGAARLYVSAAVQENDLEFQVDAQTFGFIDRTLLITEGSTLSFGAGVEWPITAKADASIGVRYSPLDVQRLGESEPSGDDLIHLRALLSVRLFD